MYFFQASSGPVGKQRAVFNVPSDFWCAER